MTTDQPLEPAPLVRKTPVLGDLHTADSIALLDHIRGLCTVIADHEKWQTWANQTLHAIRARCAELEALSAPARECWMCDEDDRKSQRGSCLVLDSNGGGVGLGANVGSYCQYWCAKCGTRASLESSEPKARKSWNEMQEKLWRE